MNILAQNELNQEQAIKYLMRTYMDKPKNQQMIHGILEDIGRYYAADRTYIFRLNAECTHASKAFSWCSDGITEKSDSLQNISFIDLEYWLKKFAEKGELFISSPADDYNSAADNYQLLTSVGADSLMAAPFMAEGRVVGFIGVDNPRRHTDDMLLLSVVSYMCCSAALTVPQAEKKRVGNFLIDENQHRVIIDFLSNIFSALYYIDLEENSFQELISHNGTYPVYFQKRNIRVFFKNALETLVAKEYQPVMRIFIDMDTLDERLGDKSIITQEYVAVSGEWIRCSFIPVEKNSCGKNIKVICMFRVINEEKEVMEVQDNLLHALSLSYENIYAVNMDTVEAVCYRMGQIMNDRYGKKFISSNYENSIRLCVENDVFEEDRYLFDDIISIPGVQMILADKKVYSFNYRVLRNDMIQYFQCQIAKPSSERNEFAIAFKNIDAEKKQELIQNRIIEEAYVALEKINERLLEEMEITAALSRDYQDIMLVDFAEDRVTIIKKNGSMLEEDIHVLPCSYKCIWNSYISKCVLDRDRAKLQEAVSFDVVQRALESNDEYTCSYRVVYDDAVIHYFQAVFMRIYSCSKAESQIILGLRNIDAIVEEEREQTKFLETQSEIIEGLASEYYSVLLVYPEMDKVTVYRATDEEGRAIADYCNKYDYCWSKGIRSYSEELVSEESRSEFLENLSLDRLKADGGDYCFVYEKLTDGGTVYLQAKIAFVQEKDGGFAVVIGTRSIDDLIRKERMQEMALQDAYNVAEAANKAKTDFLSNMSHDIRTPMNGIIGMTAIAAAHIDDKERVKDSLQKITQASKHMLSLINEVLDMSKIEAGKLELIEEEFNLSDLIDNLLTMTSSQIEEHNHELSVNISGVVHEAVIGDSLRIQKVFTNLMSNAVKFTPDGGKIRLSISERPSNHKKIGCYEFIFEDNGIGMSEEFLEQIFEPFARAMDERVNLIQGTGLGMPISRNIVRMLGGDIKVQSKLGVGSRFIVTIYLKLQDTSDIQHDKFIDLGVLVADDDPLSLESCCGMLNDLGMNADGVFTGAEAVERVVLHHQQENDYFACIIDWKMPDMDGIATTKAIRRAVGNGMPIIIISAYDWSDIEQEARAAGANAFISKPLFRSRLARTFNNLVGEEDYDEPEEMLVALENMDLTGHRVLLVEDNVLNAEIAAEILKMAGLVIEHAADGTEAVDMMNDCADGYYDIIFMDIQMPKMSGYDATRAIRTMNRNYCKQIPIIAMTANAFAEDVQAAKTVGMNEHIAKPLDLKTLAKTLKKWLM